MAARLPSISTLAHVCLGKAPEGQPGSTSRNFLPDLDHAERAPRPERHRAGAELETRRHSAVVAGRCAVLELELVLEHAAPLPVGWGPGDAMLAARSRSEPLVGFEP